METQDILDAFRRQLLRARGEREITNSRIANETGFSPQKVARILADPGRHRLRDTLKVAAVCGSPSEMWARAFAEVRANDRIH